MSEFHISSTSAPIPPTVATLYLGNTGPGATPANNQLNVIGSGNVSVNATGSTLTITSSGVSTDLHTEYFIVNPTTLTLGANYTDIPTAVAAAGAMGGQQTVWLQPGTYVLAGTLTMPAGVNISAAPCDGYTPTVEIVGSINCSNVGANAFAGIQFLNVNAPILTINGVGTTQVYFNSCVFNVQFGPAISCSSTSNASKVQIYNCTGSLNAAGTSYFAFTSGGIFLRSSHLFNSSASVTASTFSNGSACDLGNCTFANNVTTSNSASFAAILTDFFGAQGTFTINGTGTNAFNFCRIESGGSSAISVGAGAICKVINCSLNSSNVGVISGSGQVSISGVSFYGTSSSITVTTQRNQVMYNNGVQVTSPAAYPYTVIPQDSVIIVNTSASRTINLPVAPTFGEIHTVKDSTGGAMAHNVTVSGNGFNIDGAATSTLNVNYESETYVFNGNAWNII